MKRELTDEERATGRSLRKQGFDCVTLNRKTGYWRVRCSQCAALVICGTPCHETGCPNKPKVRRKYRYR